MAIKFREIEVFWAVYKAQSVKDAAQLLNVSQPAVSMMLKSAGDRFTIKLFERSGGRMKPTPEARALFMATNNVFVELQEFERQLLRIREGRGGLVRIATTPTLAAAFVHPALAAFHEQHPEIKIIVQTMPTVQSLAAVARQEVDFGLVYGPTEEPAVRAEDIGTAEVGCVLRADHALARQTTISAADLKGETITTYRSDTPLGRALGRTLRDAQIELHIAVQSTALSAAYLADRGFGVALLDPFILNDELFPNLTVRPFAPTTAARVQIITPRDEQLSLLGNDFLAQIRRFVPRQFSYSIPIRNV